MKRILCWIFGHRWKTKKKNLGKLGPPPFGPDPRMFIHDGKIYDLTKSEMIQTFTWCERCQHEPYSFLSE